MKYDNVTAAGRIRLGCIICWTPVLGILTVSGTVVEPLERRSLKQAAAIKSISACRTRCGVRPRYFLSAPGPQDRSQPLDTHRVSSSLSHGGHNELQFWCEFMESAGDGRLLVQQLQHHEASDLLRAA